ncbi:hypothetical protein ACP4OV_028827 [Aristida adscensionis]
MASRDFLGGFGGRGGESDDLELSLGLSLGGRFGAEAKRPRLARSSSIASVCLASSLGDGDGDADPSPAPAPLLRTSSLPTETEEERWRRREMQSQRRLEARRKRVERRSSMGSSATAPGRPAVDAPAAVDGLRLRRAVGSQGSSSLSTREHSNVNGVCKSSEASPSASDNTNQNSTLQPPTTAAAKPLNSAVTGQPPLRTLGSLTMRTSSTGDIRKIMMEDMPMVSSKVEGPNSRRVDGLYRYKNGEGVRIVCVCHGSFLTPAEFVKHAGGGEVSNPLRHIVINPSPSVLL